MAELFQGTQLPEWMSPSHFLLESERSAASIGQAFGSAMSSAMRQKEEKRQFDLTLPAKMKEMETQNKWREVQTAAEILQNQDRQNALDDGLAFKAAQTAWNSGDTSVKPIFRTPQGSAAWIGWKNNNEIGAIKLADRTDFINGLKEINPIGRAAVMGLPANEDGSPSHQQWMELNKWSEEERQRKHKEALELRAVSPTINAESRERIESEKLNARIKESEGNANKFLSKARLDKYHSKLQAIQRDTVSFDSVAKKYKAIDALDEEFGVTSLPEEKPVPPAQSSAPIATNPKTGEKVQLIDGKWIPLQ